MIATPRSAQALLGVVFALCAGCILPPLDQPEQLTYGRVLAVRASEIPSSGSVYSVSPGPTQGGLVTIVTPGPAYVTFVYEIRLADGRMIRIQSVAQFSIGDCLRLAFATPEGASDALKIASGRPEASDACE